MGRIKQTRLSFLKNGFNTSLYINANYIHAGKHKCDELYIYTFKNTPRVLILH
jgi:hypothetical protein